VSPIVALWLALLASPPDEAPPGPVLVNQDAGNQPQQEPTLAIDPGDSARVYVAFKDWRSGRKRVACARSEDGGRTWSDGLLGFGPNEYREQSDPWLAVDRRGNVYLGALFYRNPIADGSGIFVARSSDGGRTFAAPVAVAESRGGNQEDKDAIAVDDTGGLGDGRLYVAWAHLEDSNQDGAPDRSHVRLSCSRDQGATFGPAVTVSDGERNHGPVPLVRPDGSLAIVWVMDIRAGATRILADLSEDGGSTFGTDVVVAEVIAPGIYSQDSGFRELRPGLRVTPLPAAAVDRSDGPFRGSLYVAWTDGRTEDADILLARSRDGRRFTPPVRVNGDAPRNGRDQFFPSVAVDGSGRVHVTFLDRRDDPENLRAHLYHAVSLDGGESFRVEERVTSVPSDPRTDFNGRLLGDYNGIGAVGERVLAAWCDTARGNQDIRAALLGVAGPAALLPEAAAPPRAPRRGEPAPPRPSTTR
jgi:hypothetical protein